MTRKIVRKNDKKVLLDIKRDTLIYDSEHDHYRRTGQNNKTRGVDLYSRELPDSSHVFYLLHWSKYQGEMDYIEEITQTEASEFVEENFHYFDKEEDIEELERLGLIDMNEVV